LETFDFGSLHLNKIVMVHSLQHLGLTETIEVIISGSCESKGIDSINQTSWAFNRVHINNLVSNVEESLQICIKVRGTGIRQQWVREWALPHEESYNEGIN